MWVSKQTDMTNAGLNPKVQTQAAESNIGSVTV